MVADETNHGGKKRRLGAVALLTLGVGAIGLSGLVASGTLNDSPVVKEAAGELNKAKNNTFGYDFLNDVKEVLPSDPVAQTAVDNGTATEEVQEDLAPVYYSGDIETTIGTQVLSDGTERLYVTLPSQQFRDAQCDLTPTSLPSAPVTLDAQNQAWGQPNSWTIPAISKSAPIQESDKTLSIPDTRNVGVNYTLGAHLGDSSGAILQAGHVNYTDSPTQLSAWGYLSHVKACDSVFSTDAQGKVHEFKITDLYTVNQYDFINEDLFRKDGDLALYLVTCSGPYVGDAGQTAGGSNWIYMGYRYNLIVKAVPVN